MHPLVLGHHGDDRHEDAQAENAAARIKDGLPGCEVDDLGEGVTGVELEGLAEDVPEGTSQSVSCGYGHTRAVGTTGEVVCWGVPNKGEGAPQVNDTGQATDAPVDPGYRIVGVNSSHSCAVTVDDKVICWGSNGASKSTPPIELQP